MHQFEAGGINFAADKVTFDQANPVFAGDAAVELQYQAEDLIQTLVSALHLLRVIRVYQQVDVNVAIAGVAEIDNGDAKLLRQGLQPANQRGNIRYRYNDVFIDLLRRDVAQRR